MIYETFLSQVSLNFDLYEPKIQKVKNYGKMHIRSCPRLYIFIGGKGPAIATSWARLVLCIHNVIYINNLEQRDGTVDTMSYPYPWLSIFRGGTGDYLGLAIFIHSINYINNSEHRAGTVDTLSYLHPWLSLFRGGTEDYLGLTLCIHNINYINYNINLATPKEHASYSIDN